jgi:putative flippase GtrA
MQIFKSNRFVRFVVVGGLNTLFGFVVYSILALSDLSTLMVLIVSNLIGIAFNFVTTGGLVFREMSLTKIPLFLICYGVIFVIYLELIQWLSPIFGGRIVAMAIIVLPMAILTYFIQSWFVFGDKLCLMVNVIKQHLTQLLTAKFSLTKRKIVYVLYILAIFTAAFCNFQLVTSSFYHIDMDFFVDTVKLIKSLGSYYIDLWF